MIPSLFCSLTTAGPRLPTRRSSTRTSAEPEDLARPCAPPETGSAAATAATTSVAPATRACGSVPGSAACRFARARHCEISQTSGSVRSRATRSRPTRRVTGPSRSRRASESRLRGCSPGTTSCRRRRERSSDRSQSSDSPRSRRTRSSVAVMANPLPDGRRATKGGRLTDASRTSQEQEARGRARADEAGRVVARDRRDLHDVARVRRVDELIAADVDADVSEAVEEDEVAGLELRAGDADADGVLRGDRAGRRRRPARRRST